MGKSQPTCWVQPRQHGAVANVCKYKHRSLHIDLEARGLNRMFHVILAEQRVHELHSYLSLSRCRLTPPAPTPRGPCFVQEEQSGFLSRVLSAHVPRWEPRSDHIPHGVKRNRRSDSKTRELMKKERIPSIQEAAMRKRASTKADKRHLSSVAPTIGSCSPDLSSPVSV